MVEEDLFSFEDLINLVSRAYFRSAGSQKAGIVDCSEDVVQALKILQK